MKLGRAIWGWFLFAFIATLSRPSPARADEGRSLEVMTYNVWGVPLVAPDREARLGEIARRIADRSPDVIALQELWVREDAERMAARLREAGYPHHHIFAPASGFEDESSGLFIASRYPLEEVTFEPYAVGGATHILWHGDWMVRKGVAVVRIATPQGPVTLANTHLQATYPTGDYDFVRLSQALALTRRLLRMTDTASPLILVGDLNGTPDSLPLRVLSRALRLEPAQDGFDIDHVYARDGGELRLVPERVEVILQEPVAVAGEVKVLSDHPCVVARYRLEPCPDCETSDFTAGVGPTRLGAALDESELAREIRAQFDREKEAAERTGVLSRAALILPVLGLSLIRRRRPRRYRRLLYAASPLALLLVAYVAYLGLYFAPRRLSEVAREAATFSAALAAEGPRATAAR